MKKTSKKPGQKPKIKPKSTPQDHGKMRVFTLMSAIIGAAAVLVALIYVINKPPAPAPVVADLPKEMLPREVMNHPDFFGWFNSWRKADGYLRLQEFALENEGNFSWEAFTEAGDGSFDELPLASRYKWSPDSEFYVDFLDGFGGETVTVWLGSDQERGEVFSKRRPAYYHDAFWVGSDRLVLLGSRPELKTDGSQLCLMQEGVERCYDRLTLDVVDVAVGAVRSYVSEKHSFSLDPFAAQVRKRWSESLTEVEKARAGAASEGEIQYVDIEGVIESVDAGGLIELAADKGPVSATFAERVQIIGENGEAASFSYLKEGLAVKVVAIQPEDGSWTVVQRITVKGPLGILLYAPQPNSEVGVLLINGAAPQDVSELVVRVRNRRTGRRFYDESINLSADGSPWQEFSLEIDLEDYAGINDGISVAVYDAEDQENGHLVNVVYVP